jgi:ankyrin repeat protein
LRFSFKLTIIKAGSVLLQAGWTALHLAARAGHLAMVQLLLDSGATPRSFNDNGRIPLWYAASEGHTSVLTLLLKREHDAYGLMEDRKVRLK